MLTPNLRASLERLGATVSPGAHVDPRHDGLPPIVRALLEDVTWPPGRTYEGKFGSWNVWAAELGVFRRDVDAVQFGMYDGGNYGLFADWAGGAGANPTVYGIDHDGGGARRLASLEDFFAALSVVPVQRVVGHRGAELLDALGDGGRDVVERVAALLADGADPDACNERGVTALHVATRSSRVRDPQVLPLVERLLAAGADPRAALPADVDVGPVQGERGMTALHFIAVKSSMPVADQCAAIRGLLAHGADHGARTACGNTALHLAHYADPAVTPALVEAGADPGAATTVARFAVLPGATPLHAAVYSRPHVEALLASPRVVVDAADAGGLTALHQAVLADAADVVDVLLRAGADPTRGLTAPRRVSHRVTRADVMLPAGCTAPEMAAQVGAATAVARLAAGPAPAST